MHASLGELLDAALVRRMGGVLEAEDEARMADWLGSLPAVPVAPAELETFALGREVFEREGCASCHFGPQHTDGALHVLDGSGPWRTASLVGVALRPPYLHDGRAADLQAVLEVGPGSHALGEAVDEEERGALLAYLRSL